MAEVIDINVARDAPLGGFTHNGTTILDADEAREALVGIAECLIMDGELDDEDTPFHYGYCDRLLLAAKLVIEAGINNDNVNNDIGNAIIDDLREAFEKQLRYADRDEDELNYPARLRAVLGLLDAKFPPPTA
jgi:hypothetical protein